MEKLVIGIVQRPHGIRGFVKVKSLSGETAHFLCLEWVYLRKGGSELRFEVENAVASGKDILLKLRGIDSPELSLPYVMAEVIVPREQASPLNENEFYCTDLCLCTLVHRGTSIGRVISIIDGSAGALLEIERTTGQRILIPFVEAHIGTVDLLSKTIELKHLWVLA